MNSAVKQFLLVAIGCLAVLTGGLAVFRFVLPPRVLTNLDGQPPLSPLYAFWMPVLSPKVLRPILAGAGYVCWFLVLDRGVSRGARATAGLLFAQIVWLVVLAQLVAGIRLPLNDLGASMTMYAGEDLWDDVRHVQSPGDFLTEFSSLHRNNKLSLHGKTHPPGHTLFLWIATRVLGASTHRAALAILLVGGTGIVPVFLLARRVFGERVATRVRVLYPVVPGVLLFSVSSTDFLFAAVAAWSLWLAIEAVLGRGVVIAVTAGVFAGMAAMFSVAEVFVMMLVGVFAVACWINRPDAPVVRQLAVMAASAAGWFVFLRFGFNFDYLECLRLTRRFHDSFIRDIAGGMTAATWRYTSVGNILAFGWYLGLPVVTGVVQNFVAALWRGVRADADQQFVRAFAIVFAIMSFGGLFVLEVERIWLFLIGPAVAVAGSAFPRFDDARAERRWLAVWAATHCLQSIAFETLFFTIW
jgi:hypothetical protein